MNNKLKIILIIIIIFLILLFFLQHEYKTVKTGNNIFNKSSNDLIEYILNISSYEAKLEVTIYSNKTTNKYMLEQYYLKPNYAKQIVKEPKNIENLEIIYNGKDVEIKNTNLGLNKIYKNYNDLNDNVLWLNYFIDNYQNEYNVEENDEEIILKSNLSTKYKTLLYINKEKSLPIKMEVLDNNNKLKVYIEYKEIKLNSIQENNIFALKTKDINKEV